MFSQLSPKERAVYVILIAALLFGFGFVGMRHLQKAPELKLESVAEKTPSFISETPKEIVVHVVGAVKSPGVVRMEPESRVQDAIDACGGAKSGAGLEEINLAAKLVDGSQLQVPMKGEAAIVAEPYQAGTEETYRAKPASAKSSGAPASGSISLNSANASQLDRLPGVGPATAAKILQYRQDHGGFTSVDELLAVKGIGPKKLAAMRKFVKL